MARPIAPTPQLDVEETRAFLEKVAQDLKTPIGPVPTPNIDKAIEMVMADAQDRAK